MITDIAYIIKRLMKSSKIPLIKKLCHIKAADVIRLNIAKQNNIYKRYNSGSPKQYQAYRTALPHLHPEQLPRKPTPQYQQKRTPRQVPRPTFFSVRRAPITER